VQNDGVFKKVRKTTCCVATLRPETVIVSEGDARVEGFYGKPNPFSTMFFTGIKRSFGSVGGLAQDDCAQ